MFYVLFNFRSKCYFKLMDDGSQLLKVSRELAAFSLARLVCPSGQAWAGPMMYTWVPASINLSLSDPSLTSPGTEAGEAGVWGDWGWTSLEKLEVRVTHLTYVTKYYVTQITCHDITHPALSAVPSPSVTKAPSKFSATFCNPVSKVEVISLAALPSYKRNVQRIC